MKNDSRYFWLRWMVLTVFGFVLGASGAVPTPADLLRQGVIAEETGGDLQRSLTLYREAVAIGESHRIATATALFRLGELEWRQGKTNDASRTWQLLAAQYPDQTNLLVLARDRVPLLGMPTAPLSPVTGAGMSAIERAAADVGQLDPLSHDQAFTWLNVRGVATPKLVELEQQRTELRRSLEVLSVNYGAGNLEVVKNRKLADLNQEQFVKEVEEIIASLKMMRDSGGSTVSSEELAELARVKRLFKDSPDLLTSPAADGQLTPLENAAFKGYLGVVEFLISQNFDLKRSRALHVAAAGGRQAMVQRLIAAGVDVNRPDSIATPLTYAVAHGHRLVVETLLKSGADVNGRCWNPSRRQPLPSLGGQSWGNQHYDKTVYTLESFGTPVHVAMYVKNLPLAVLLLSNGADPNTSNSAGVTLLHTAAYNNQLELAGLLLEKGANPNRLAYGKTPLAVASSLEMAKLLLEAKADPNLAGEPAKSPLWLASHAVDLPRVSALIEHGAKTDFNAEPGSLIGSLLQRTDFRNPNRNPVELYEVLFKAGARFQSRGPQRLLHRAVESTDPEFVRLALRYGEKADLDEDVRPPLAGAVESGNSRIVELLLNAGADPNKHFKLDGPTWGTLSSYSLAKQNLLYPTQVSQLMPIVGQAPGVPSRRLQPNGPQGTNPTSDLSERQTILALLLAKGGRDFFSQSNAIQFSVNLTNGRVVIREATPVSTALEYRLSDLLESLLTRPLQPGQENQAVFPWYPDLRRAEIYNDLERTQPARREPVDIQALIDDGEFGKSRRLEWGDILVVNELPATERREPFVLSAAKTKELKSVNRRILTLKFGNETIQLELLDNFVWVNGAHYGPLGETGEIRTVLKSLQGRNLQFHSRFRVVRRGEPGALDQIYPFKSTNVYDGRSRASSDEVFRGDWFRFQDGDEVTLYPLPTP